MKTTLLAFAILSAIVSTGCQKATEEANRFKNDTVNAFNKASQQVEDTKKQIVDTKNKVDEKVQQAKDAMDAINKLTGT